jgi:hypothetical protein
MDHAHSCLLIPIFIRYSDWARPQAGGRREGASPAFRLPTLPLFGGRSAPLPTAKPRPHERRHGMFIRHTCHSRKRELLLERAAGLRRAETGRD